ncbi:MAG: hypothetical protein IPJ81_13805 [Chitinophagaceae bacterium]|nr:hypothetical protein [Chitinophagaceae bacterium]
MTKVFILIFALVFLTKVNGQQNKTYIQDLNFIQQKIKNNYPAYSEKLHSSYKKLLFNSEKKIYKSQDSIFNFHQLINPVLFFKDLHLRLSSVKPIIFDSFFVIISYKKFKLNLLLQEILSLLMDIGNLTIMIALFIFKMEKRIKTFG